MSRLGGQIGTRRWVFGMWFLVLCLPSLLATARPYLLTDRYVVHNWQTEDGLPENSATAMVQTPDGYLWFGTFYGLVRFDGVHFKIYDTLNTPELHSRQVVNLYLDRHQVMWISVKGALVRYRAGQFEAMGPEDGWESDFVRNFAEADDGSLYMTSFGGEIYRMADEGIEKIPVPPEGKPDSGWLGVVNSANHLIVRQDQYIARWDGEEWSRLYPTAGEDSIYSNHLGLGPARQEGIWLLKTNSLVRLESGVALETRQVNQPIKGFWSLHEDHNGSVWICSFTDGVLRVDPDGATVHYGEAILPYPAARFVFEDEQENIWIGTSGGGLLRLMPRLVQNIGVEEGLPERVVKSVSAFSDGALAIGTYGGGVHILRDGIIQPVELPVAPGHAVYAQSVLVDSSDRLWIGCYEEGLFRHDGETVEVVWTDRHAGQNVRALFEDSRGDIWAAGENGVSVIRDRAITDYPASSVRPTADVLDFAEDVRGRIWAGGRQGMAVLNGNDFFPATGPAEDLRNVISLLIDQDNAMWVGVEGAGLYRVRSGERRFVGHNKNLPVRSVTGMYADSTGNVWMTSNRGIAGTSFEELNAVADGRKNRLQSRLLGLDEGMVSIECSGDQSPNIATTADGRIWVATMKGVAHFQSGIFSENEVPPGVVLDQLRFRPPHGREDAPRPESMSPERVLQLPPVRANPLKLEPGTHFLEFHYSGLGLPNNRRIQFQIRMEGLDGGWEDVGTRRVAYYHELPPGDYAFQVRAAAEDGRWNPEPAIQAFTIRPYYWQTWWFRSGFLLTLAAGAIGLIRHFLRLEVSTRMASEKARGEVRERFYQVLENTSDAVGFATPDRKIFYLNRKARDILGVTGEELEQLKPEEVYPEWAFQLVTNVALPAVREKGSWEGHSAMRSRDGREIPMWQVMLAIRKPDGEIDFVASIGRDTTPIKKAEEALRASEEKFSRAFHASPDSVTISHLATGKLIEVNEGFERMFGHTAREAKGRTTLQLGIWSDPADRTAILEKVKKRESVRNFEASYRTKDGGEGMAVVSAEPIVIGGEECLLVIARDITEIELSRKQLRDSQDKLTMALASSHMGTWEWNIQTNEVVWSGEVEAIFNLSPGTFGKTLAAYEELVYPEDLPLVRATIQKTLEGDPENYHIEHRIQPPRGRIRWVEARGKLYRDPQGRPERMLGTVYDITTRKTNEGILISIARGLSAVTDEAFFRSLVETLARVTEADLVFVGHRSEQDPAKVRTIGMYAEGRVQDQAIEFPIDGSPCSEVLDQGDCMVLEAVQERYPSDAYLKQWGVQTYLGTALLNRQSETIGLLCILYREPPGTIEMAEHTLAIFADRTAAELERMRVQQDLKRLNSELEARVRERTDELQRLVNLMAGRELKMAELKKEIRELRDQSGNPS